MIKIALMGFGIVGHGVYSILKERNFEIQKIIGQDFEIKHILVRSPEKYTEIEKLVTSDINKIVNDKDIDCVIEATGEVEGIIEEVKTLLSNNVNFISANKALISKYFYELNNLAKGHKTALLYEAAVGAALPILNQVLRIKTLNEVEEVYGVLNGTTNYILTKMEEGMTYDEALVLAQEIGFAEADPSSDVDGLDSMRKIRILAGHLYNYKLTEEDIEVSGISNVKSEDIERAKKANKTIKLIARANKNACVKVGIEEVDENSILGRLKNGENALVFKTSNAKDIVIKGEGAGSRETAFAVLSDFIDIYKVNKASY